MKSLPTPTLPNVEGDTLLHALILSEVEGRGCSRNAGDHRPLPASGEGRGGASIARKEWPCP